MLKKTLLSFIPALVWVLIIVVGSFLPSSNIPSLALSDKGIHFVFYAILATLLYFPFRINTNRNFTFVTTCVSVLMIGFVLGSVIELIQDLFIPGRFGELLDLVANTFGLFTGLAVSEMLKRIAVL